MIKEAGVKGEASLHRLRKLWFRVRERALCSAQHGIGNFSPRSILPHFDLPVRLRAFGFVAIPFHRYAQSVCNRVLVDQKALCSNGMHGSKESKIISKTSSRYTVIIIMMTCDTRLHWADQVALRKFSGWLAASCRRFPKFER